MNKELIIMGCSNLKNHIIGQIEAFTLYNGVFYKVLKKAFREKPELVNRIDILILSAKYGIITAGTQIKYYDQKMDGKRSEILKEESTRKLRQYLSNKNYNSCLVVMGKHYRNSIDWKDIDLKQNFIIGGIGIMQKELRAWILSL